MIELKIFRWDNVAATSNERLSLSVGVSLAQLIKSSSNKISILNVLPTILAHTSHLIIFLGWVNDERCNVIFDLSDNKKSFQHAFISFKLSLPLKSNLTMTQTQVDFTHHFLFPLYFSILTYQYIYHSIWNWNSN